MKQVAKCECGAKAVVMKAGNGQFKVVCTAPDHACSTGVKNTAEEAIAIWNS